MHQAERWVRELECDPQVNGHTLARALRLAKAAKELDAVDTSQRSRTRKRRRI